MRRPHKQFFQLTHLMKSAYSVEPDRGDRFVVFSDLHMGNGRRSDDFKNNAELFMRALSDYYLPEKYKLILNGDIEELQKFRLEAIKKRWSEVYRLFRQFQEETALYKTVGNHDLNLIGRRDYTLPVYRAIKLKMGEFPFLIYHGHQTQKLYTRFNSILGFILNYLAAPLGIKNYSVAENKLKKYKVESTAYDFSRSRKVLSILGHTHRPLFESQSKQEAIEYQIEFQLRQLRNAKAKKRAKLEDSIRSLKNEWEENALLPPILNSRLYSSGLLVPCTFNSGCTIGKRGMTCLEIDDKEIKLVHWFDRNISSRYLESGEYEPLAVDPEKRFYRMEFKGEQLSYIYDCMRLLT